MTLQELKHKYIEQSLKEISLNEALYHLSRYMIDEYKDYTKEQMLELLENSRHEALLNKYLYENQVA